jgi:hypothetical protein
MLSGIPFPNQHSSFQAMVSLCGCGLQPLVTTVKCEPSWFLRVRPMVTNSSSNGLVPRVGATVLVVVGPGLVPGLIPSAGPVVKRDGVPRVVMVRPPSRVMSATIMARKFCLLVPGVYVGSVLLRRRIRPTFPVVPVRSGTLWPEGRRLPVLTVPTGFGRFLHRALPAAVRTFAPVRSTRERNNFPVLLIVASPGRSLRLIVTAMVRWPAIRRALLSRNIPLLRPLVLGVALVLVPTRPLRSAPPPVLRSRSTKLGVRRRREPFARLLVATRESGPDAAAPSVGRRGVLIVLGTTTHGDRVVTGRPVGRRRVAGPPRGSTRRRVL